MQQAVPREIVPWAKLRRADEDDARREKRRAVGPASAWRSLLDHSADVAAVFDATVRVSGTFARLERLANRALERDTDIARLGVLAAMHDFGKANRGFQARRDSRAELIGHVHEAWVGLNDAQVLPRLADAIPLREADSWFGPGSIAMAVAHHGFPLNPVSQGRDDKALWAIANGDDPVASLAPLGAAIRLWFPTAFDPRPGRYIAPPAWHMISGLLTLADWIASDEAFFPLSPVGEQETGSARFEQSREQAQDILRRIGFDPTISRRALPSPPSFSAISDHPPRPIQLAAGETDDEAQVMVLESETGSGKTEAALLRFARLFDAGAIEGLYFALPTRVAATALHARVETAVRRLWPVASSRPAVVLAVPGQEIARERGLKAPAGGHDVWENEPANHEEVWAASRPKKYLAGTIAVGTIDQALLGIIKAKHAHLRLSCLTRHLLVVDEVHASDRYMEFLLTALLRFHRRAGGQALLLSATLGARAREKLLGRAEPPPLAEAIAAPYPALSTDARDGLQAQPWEGRGKDVRLSLSTNIGDATAIAGMAVEAARTGAKVLVIRNLRRDAVAIFEAVRANAPDAPVFSCGGVATLHHGRFAREDRPRLDAAVEAAIGRTRASGGLIVIGTQTLEQSLDICADFLISDITPADVLLQRLGRLHRHTRDDRPTSYERAQATVLVPPDMAAVIRRPAHGLGVGKTFAMPYPDVITVEATRRLLAEYPVWSIPAMNRLLVEGATHPQARAILLDALRKETDDWEKADIVADGRVFAHLGQAGSAILRTDVGFEDPAVVFSADDIAATRLGAKDALIELPDPVAGPFGAPVRSFQMPAYWGVDPAEEIDPRVIEASNGAVVFEVQGRQFRYDARGLDIQRLIVACGHFMKSLTRSAG